MKNFIKNYLRTSLILSAILMTSITSGFAQDFIYTKWKTFEGYNDFVRDFKFSAKSNYSALTTGDNKIELYDKNFTKIWSYQGNSKNRGGRIVFSPDEKYLIFSCYQSSVDFAVLRIADKKIIQLANTKQQSWITAFVLSPDGKTLMVGGDEHEIQFYNLNGEKFELVTAYNITDKDFQYIYTFCVSPDNKYYVAAGIADSVRIFVKSQNKFIEAQTIPQRYWVNSSCYHPKENKFVFATGDSNFVYENKSANKCAFTKFSAYDNGGGESNDMKFTNDGKFLCAAKTSSVIKIWEWNKGLLKEATELGMHEESVFTVNFTSDDNYMASAGLDKKAIIWKSANAPDVSEVVEPANKGVKLIEDNDTKPNMTGLAGQNYLLVIGINKYVYWPQLNNATKDAKDVKAVLLEKYQFKAENVSELYDDQATYKNILEKMVQIKSKANANDGLLIYFSGHGFYNKGIDEGYWIPVDAHKDAETEFLPNSTLLKYLKAFEAKHIFLVADACFSGALFSQGSRGYIDNVEKYKSRWGLTSGRLEVVSDGTSGNNSPFASYFLKFLKDNTKKQFPCSEIIQFVKVAVANNSEQTPIGSPLKNVGDEGGEFIFYLK